MRFVDTPEFKGIRQLLSDKDLKSDSRVLRRSFQLSAMSSFLLAIKVSGESLLSPDVLSGLSRNLFSTMDIVCGEQLILTGLDWHVHPITSFDILHQLHSILLSFRPLPPSDSDSGDDEGEVEGCDLFFWENTWELVEDMTRHFVEISMADLLFKDESPLHVALSTIIFAFDHVPLPNPPSEVLIDEFKEVVKRETGEEPDGGDVQSNVASFIQIFNRLRSNFILERDIARAVRTQSTEAPINPYLYICGLIPSQYDPNKAMSPKRRATSPVSVDGVDSLEVDTNITRKTRRLNID
eukprot:CAMPEP_0118648366 /NCGR_PEP_ID=MMETSP0785-20121206/9116_1 /TAXON_ID=91992 /ORGANISM="Bolidomonas pacifica, Strain CCMP 1866" /LENGTH=295 /DNA_ID=CAMNT_0006540551 /DNA_START=147 /DNA_END=1034 /DNA_ORIENTATION=+